MNNRRIHRFGLGFLLTAVIITVCVWSALAMTQKTDAPESSRADMITIDGLKSFGPLERPAVLFYHDKHTEALAQQKKDCTSCHETVKDQLSLKFKRTQDTDKQQVMDIYHDNCISCHKTSATPDKPAGPVTCGQCHVKEGTVPPSSWQPIDLDKSLHYRHVEANEKKCEQCHHEYNPQTKKLFYAKGQEGACIYCHKEMDEENRIANRAASHIACINCHRRLTAQKKDAGPLQCAGCHDAGQQALIKKVTDIPRMERNQPDAVMVKVMAKKKDAEPVVNRMLPVPFDHKSHERYTDSCQVCHHAALTPCASCHTLSGDKDGDLVKLAQAMHQPDTDQSCVGCHNRQQAQPECAGCHSMLPQARSLTTKASCRNCHLETTADNPYPVDEAEAKVAAVQRLAARTLVTETVALDQIPEQVTIKALANEYEPVTLPHRKMVLKLVDVSRNSKMAAYFHTEPTTLCQGCHHNSPASVKPPQCGSCHGRSSEALNLTRPGLMAAYHQQCIQCHDKMGLEKPSTRECTACHAKRK